MPGVGRRHRSFGKKAVNPAAFIGMRILLNPTQPCPRICALFAAIAQLVEQLICNQ